MPDIFTKSHKSRKTETPDEPRQRTLEAFASPASSLVEGTSSLVPATPAPDAPIQDSPVYTPAPTPLPKEQQPWYRAPDSKLRKQSEKIAVMRAAGRKTDDIAKRMHTTAPNVRFVEYIARKNGWYDAEGEPVDLEADLALTVDRKIVRNIDASLDGQMTNWQTHEMTIAAAKGRGIFKNHDKVEGAPQQLQVVAIRVEMPAVGASDQHVIEDNVGGTPAYIEGEVAHELGDDGVRPTEDHPEAI